MNRTFINCMAFSACLVGTALILAEECKKSAPVSASIEQPIEGKYNSEGGRIIYDKVEKFTIMKVRDHHGLSYSIILYRESNGKVTGFHSKKPCDNLEKIEIGKAVNLRYVVTRYNSFPAQGEGVLGGEALCPA